MPNSKWGNTGASVAATPSLTDVVPGTSASAVWGSITGASAQAAPAGGWTGTNYFTGVSQHNITNTSGQSIQDFNITMGVNTNFKFANVQIGGQTLGLAYLKWERDSSQGRQFSIFTSDNGGTSRQALLCDYSGNTTVNALTATGATITDSNSLVSSPLQLINNYGASASLAEVGMWMGRPGTPFGGIYGLQEVSNDYGYGSLHFKTRTSDALGLETKLTILSSGAATFASSVSMGALTATRLDITASTPADRIAQIANTSATGYGTIIQGGNASQYTLDLRDYSGTSKVRFMGDGSVSMGALTATTGGFSGNVGIGTSAPASYKLSIVHATGTNCISLQAGSAGVWQIGANAGSGPGDDAFGIYSATYGPSHGYVPVFWLSSTGAATFSSSVSMGALTATSVGGFTLPSTGSANGTPWTNLVATKADGVTEIGKYLDFHESASDGVDFSARLYSASGVLTTSASVSMGALTATGISISGTGNTLTSGSTGTGANFMQLVNAGGTTAFGLENSASTYWGTTAYDFTIAVPNGRGISLFMGGVGTLARFWTGNASFGANAVSMGALTATTGLFSSGGGATSSVTIGQNTAGNPGAKLTMLGYATSYKNWQIDVGMETGNFNICPSTTDGGSTFTTPALYFDRLSAATFAGSVSMGALTATSGTFSGLLTMNAGASIAANYGLAIADGAPGATTGKLYSVATNALMWSGNLVLTLGNVGTNAATLQAAVASATAPMVGTHAQMVAYGPGTGLTPYWYATDDTESDGALGKLWKWNGSAWVAVGTPSTIVGRVTAGVISAGAVGAQAIAADVALIGQVLRNTGFTAGTSSVAPSGFKFSGTAFTATLLDGTTLSVFGEIGADLSIGGLKAAVIANRVKGNLFYRNTAGTTDVFIPDGVVSIEVTLQATGGTGASSYGTGGAGGQYIKAMVTVKPHNTYRLTLGAAGSNSTFTWVSFDGTSGFTTDSGFATITATCGAAGSVGSGTGAQGADIGFSYPGPESSWNIGGAAAGDNLAAGAISQAGRGGNIYGLGNGGNGGGTTATKQGGGGGGASATGNGGGGGMNPANGQPGTSGGGGGGGSTGGAGGVGFVRAKW